ncbi:MAG: hypothetical protein MZV64_17670 [Ignavibacteriales bacterium]|nr:hypothetical protein [Ignavibacteriales bacterium]
MTARSTWWTCANPCTCSRRSPFSNCGASRRPRSAITSATASSACPREPCPRGADGWCCSRMWLR